MEYRIIDIHYVFYVCPTMLLLPSVFGFVCLCKNLKLYGRSKVQKIKLSILDVIGCLKERFVIEMGIRSWHPSLIWAMGLFTL